MNGGAARDTGRASDRTLLVSIHNHYARLILAGKKSVELRRRFDASAAGSRMLIYATQPTAAVIGHVDIEKMDVLPVDELWQQHGESAVISTEDFKLYYDGADTGCALLLSNPTTYQSPVPLKNLREEYGLNAPQSYLVLKEAHRDLIEHEQG